MGRVDRQDRDSRVIIISYDAVIKRRIYLGMVCVCVSNNSFENDRNDEEVEEVRPVFVDEKQV